jgi:hypothetical protein
MTIQEAIARADDATCRATLEYILSEFAKPAFGALPKKEIELLMLEALVRIGYLNSEPSLYQLIQLLRVSRSKSRSLVYERDLRRLGKSQLDDLLKDSLARPYVLKQGDLFCLEIENPLVIDHLKDKLKQLGFATDGSFSPSLVRLSRDAFNALVVSCVGSDRQEAVKAALVAAGAPDGTFGGVIKGVLVKLGGKFADSAGEELAGNISEYLGPILSGATSEITSRVSELFRDLA